MKPRLYVKWHVWVCATLVPRSRLRTHLGYGYTPKDAYDDWADQRLRALGVLA